MHVLWEILFHENDKSVHTLPNIVPFSLIFFVKALVSIPEK